VKKLWLVLAGLLLASRAEAQTFCSTNVLSSCSFNLNSAIVNSGLVISSNANWAPTCTFASGGGTTPACAMDANSANTAGIINASTGTGTPGSQGTLTLTFSGAVGTNAPACVFNLMDGAGTWNAAAKVAKITAASTTAVTFAWDNNAVVLPISTQFKASYVCIGK
jgi:hypothetical protein